VGEGVTLSCDKCGFEVHLSQGVGMSAFASDEDAVRAYCGNSEANKFHTLLAEKQGEISELGYKVYECGKCGVWQQKSGLGVTFDDGTSYVRQHRCVKCRSKLDREIDIADYRSCTNSQGLYLGKCRKCGISGLNEICLVLWD
jgi:hypothetical protein